MESDQRVHTKFFETDRSLSSFTMMCQPDGSFKFENVRSKWPTCLEGIEIIEIETTPISISDIDCSPQPPPIPTDPEYVDLPRDDGKVDIRSLLYPSRERMDMIWNSSNAANLIPRNYIANLTYTCGSARKFITPDGPIDSHSITCQWDR